VGWELAVCVDMWLRDEEENARKLEMGPLGLDLVRAVENGGRDM